MEAPPAPEPTTIPSSTSRPTFQDKYWLSTQDILDKGISESQVSQFRQHFFHLSFAVNSFYNFIPKTTFKTEFLKINHEFANAIIEKQIAKIQNKPLALKHSQVLKAFSKEIEPILAKFPNGCFFKLNSRSPKDAMSFQRNNSTLVDLVKRQTRNSKTVQECLFGLQSAFLLAQKVKTVDQVMNLLENSHRIFEDLSTARQFPESQFLMQLVFRDFDDHVSENPQCEFRCFVWKRQLNGISQYFTRGYWPQLVKSKLQIQNQILDYWKSQIRDKIPHDSYILDIFHSSKKTFVIELNSFHTWTGACLFSWKNDRDNLMLGPLKFLVRTEPVEDSKLFQDIPPEWQKLACPSEIYSKYCPNDSRCILL